MKTIAILTMLYLPASLVCSFFGSNFFAFQTNDNGHQELLVSNLIWICFLASLILTTLTIFVWTLWQRRSSVSK